MSQWKLVEAEPLGGQNGSDNIHHKYGGNNYQSRHRRNSRGGGDYRRRGGGRRGNNHYDNMLVSDTPESRRYYAQMAVQVIEYYFSPDSLCADMTIRSYMDEEGYVPIALVCNFPDVLAVGAYYEDIISALGESSAFELDLENETMRLPDYRKWLMPNGKGGFGLPRYIIQQPWTGAESEDSAVVASQQEVGNEENKSETRDRSLSKELSAAATVYTPSSPEK